MVGITKKTHLFLVFVKKEVTQKLIDESKHIKLEAEKDTGSFRSRFARNQQQQKNQKRSASSADIVRIFKMFILFYFIFLATILYDFKF